LNSADKKIFKELYKPFPLDRVKFRVGARTKDKKKCIPLAYVDARDVIQRLNNTFGLGWESSQTGMGGCSLTLPFGEKRITRTDDAGETKVEAEKGKYSGALKRAAVHFGVGLYLYYFPNVYVDFDGYGIGMKNNNFLVGGREESPFLDWMDPDNWDKYADIFLGDRVEELAPMEVDYRKRFKYSYTAPRTTSQATPSPEPAHTPTNNSSSNTNYSDNPAYTSFIFTFGKYKDTYLKDLTDLKYLTGYLLEKCNNEDQLVLYRIRLKELGG